MNASQPTPPTDGWGLDDFLDVVAVEMTRRGIAGTAPDRRTARYYATAGALDRPSMVGREARYHAQHLGQLLALKRLQADGLRLAAIIDRLAGADDAQLERLATGQAEASPELRPEAQFWEQRPARRPATSPAPAPTMRRQTRIDLAPTVHLVIDDVELSSTEALSLGSAAADLLARLRDLGVDIP